MSNLMLHCDAYRADRAELADLPVPDPTETWQPVSHDRFDILVRQAMEDMGIVIQAAEYGLSKPDDRGYRHRMFGIYHTTQAIIPSQVGAMVGLRNSTDMSLSAGIVFGSRVFVCDNRAFAGQYIIMRRHTKNISDSTGF